MYESATSKASLCWFYIYGEQVFIMAIYVPREVGIFFFCISISILIAVTNSKQFLAYLGLLWCLCYGH